MGSKGYTISIIFSIILLSGVVFAAQDSFSHVNPLDPTVSVNPVAVTDPVSIGLVGATSDHASGIGGFQWQDDCSGSFSAISDGGVYSGATTDTLTISAADASHECSYRVLTTELPSGSTLSNPVYLTVKSLNAHWEFESAGIDSAGSNDGCSTIFPTPLCPGVLFDTDGGTPATTTGILGSSSLDVIDNGDAILLADDDPTIRPRAITVTAWGKLDASILSEPRNLDEVAHLVSKWSTRDSLGGAGGTFPEFDAFNLGVRYDSTELRLEPTCRLSEFEPAGMDPARDPIGACSPTGGSGTVNEGQWHHYAMTYNPDATCPNNFLLLDGDVVFSRCFSGDIGGTASLEIGMEQSGDSRPWDGQIDDVRIYDYALTESEIETIIALAGAPADPTSTTSSTSTNDQTPALTGTSDFGTTVTLSSDLAGTLGSVIATSPWIFDDGDYSGNLAEGPHIITATATHGGGTSSPPAAIATITVDITPPTFEIEYFSDAGLTASLGNNPILKAGTYYLQITSNEALTGNPVLTIDAEGIANDVGALGTTSEGGNVYSFTRTIAFDAAAVGTTIEDVSITIGDIAGNVATDADPTNEATKAAFTDTVAPTISNIVGAPNSGPPTGVNGEVLEIGNSDLTLTVVMSEDVFINTGLGTLGLTLNDPVPSVLLLYAGSSSPGDTVSFPYTVTEGDGDVTTLDVLSLDASSTAVVTDAAGNEFVDETLPGTPTLPTQLIGIDSTRPTVVSSVVTPQPIAEADTNPPTLMGVSIVTTFSEDMDQTSTPTVTFATGDAIGTTFDNVNGFSDWMSATEYDTVYDALDDDIMVTGAVALVNTGATDLAGNAQAVDGTGGVTFEVDTAMPEVDASVISVTTNAAFMNTPGTIADADKNGVGIGTFTVKVIYDETMDNSVNPTITFSPNIETSGTLTFSGGAWTTTTLTDDTYTESYTIGDVGEDQNSVDISNISGALDAAGNTQVAYAGLIDATEGPFAVDQLNPTFTISDNSGGLDDIFATHPDTGAHTASDSDVGDTYTVTVDYNEPMSGAPTITFLANDAVTNVEGTTLTAGVGAYTGDGSDYVKDWTVADGNEDRTGNDITAAGATDLVGNVQNPASGTAPDEFDVDNLNPTFTISDNSGGLDDIFATHPDTGAHTASDSDAGDTYTVTVDYNEPMLAVPAITFLANDAVTNVEGTTLTAGAGAYAGDGSDYVKDWTVADGNEDRTGNDITAAGATDLVGNVQNPASGTAPDEFDVDNLNPTFTISDNSGGLDDIFATHLDTGAHTASDSDAGDTYTVTVDYNEPMLAVPAITFLANDAVTNVEGTTLTLGAGSYTGDGSDYVKDWTVADGNEDRTGNDITAAGATDRMGNVQNPASGTAPDEFDVDNLNPLYVSFTDNSDSIFVAHLFTFQDTMSDSDADEGIDADDLTTITTYNEPMDTAEAQKPVVSFVTDVEASGSLDDLGSTGSWDATAIDSTVYGKTWELEDVGETVSVDITVTGARDIIGNLVETDNDITPGFDVDTENPRIPATTLTIASTNTYDPGTTLATQVATTGNTITILLDANEPLDIPVDADLFIQTIPATDASITITDGTANDNSMTATLLVGGTEGTPVETQGVTDFLWTFRDLMGNFGDPDNEGDGFSISITPEPATKLHITDGSQVVLDYTSPPARTVIIQSLDDLIADPQFTYERIAQDIALTCDDDFDTVIAVAECFETKITGVGLDPISHPSPVFEPFVTTETRDFTSERGIKAITVEFVDRAGNSNTVDDAINLDAIISSSFALTSTDGEWEDVVFEVTGAIENPQVLLGTADKVLVDFKYRLDFDETFDFPSGNDDDGDGAIDEDPINGVDDDADTLVDEDTGGYEHPSPAQCVTLTPDASDPNGDRYLFEATSEYPRPSQDTTDSNPVHTHVPEAILVLGDCTDGFDFASTVFTPVTETSVTDGPAGTIAVDRATANTQESLERATTVNLNVATDTFINFRFAVTGGQSPAVNPAGVAGLVEDVDVTGVPGKLIEFEGSGSPEGIGTLEDLNDVLSHDGVTFNDDEGIVVGGDGIIRLTPATDSAGTGAVILTPHLPGYVTLTIEDSEDNLIEIEVTDGSIPPQVSTEQLVADSTSAIGIPIIDENGIAKIEIKEIFSDDEPPVSLSGKTLGLSKIETRGLELEKINVIEFTAESFTSKTFDIGFFSSEGTAQSTKADNLVIKAKFTDVSDPDYLPSPDLPIPPLHSNQRTYSVFTASNSGYDNTGTATIREDNNKGIPAKQCATGDDTDGDAICDSWETGGIPYKIFSTYLMPLDLPCPSCTGTDVVLPSGRTANLITVDGSGNPLEIANDLTPVVGIRDVYIEIDAMELHAPDILALNDVIKLYADATDSPSATGPIALHIFLNQGTSTTSGDGFAHKDTIKVWNEGLRFFDNNFNGLKAENYGTRDLTTPFITKDEVVKVEVVNAELGQYNLLITGYEITTPFDSRTTPTVDRTRGVIQNRVLFDTTSSPGITIGNSDASGMERTQPNAGVANMEKLRLKSINALGSGRTIIAYDQTYLAKTKLNDFGLGEYKIPVTLLDPAGAPKGCTDDNGLHPTDSFCDDGRVLGEYPKIDSRLKNDAYAQAYRYAMYVHSFGGPSGEAELRGNDMVVALGVGFGEAFNGHPGGTRHQQSGTVAHEFLHLFNGMHGGPQYLISDVSQTNLADTPKNCKPYPGVDKYTNQLPNIYLDLALSDPTDPRSDVLSTSEWQLQYSDGTHGINLQEATTETTHFNNLVLAGTTVGGLSEAALIENPATISGTPYTMIWSTPATVDSHTGPHGNHKQLSTTTNIDWNDSGTASGTVSADINNFGTAGCVAGTDAEYYDYDAFYHMDFDFRQGISGAFDGITNFVNDASGNDLWRSIAAEATFEGLDPGENLLTANQAANELITDDLQGGSAVIAGGIHQVVIQLLAQVENEGSDDPINLQGAARAQVWVSKDPNAGSEGMNPLNQWRQIFDSDPTNLGGEFMRWVEGDTNIIDSPSQSLVMDWDTSVFTTDPSAIGLLTQAEVDGPWYLRIVLSDNPLSEDEGTIICEANVIEQLPGGIGDPLGCFKTGAGLFGVSGDPLSNFLQDLTPECIGGGLCEAVDPGAAHLKVTGQINLKLPETMKTDAFTQTLENLLSTATQSKTIKELKHPIKQMDESINHDHNPWLTAIVLDPNEGKHTFNAEAHVVKHLAKIAGLPHGSHDDSGPHGHDDSDHDDSDHDDSGHSHDPFDESAEFLATVERLTTDIATVDRILTRTAISAATLGSDGSSKAIQELAKADEDFGRGDGHFTLQEYHHAIQDYEKAWKHSQKVPLISLGGQAPSNSNSENFEGNEGNNKIKGGDGDDSIFGFGGKDTLDGNDGEDDIHGGTGDDKLKGGDDDDELFGGDGKDNLKGGNDDDKLYGNDGNDKLYGQNGDDLLVGGAGNDYLNGGKGNDELIGGPGKNTLNGGKGSDTCTWDGGKNGPHKLLGADDKIKNCDPAKVIVVLPA